MKSRDSRLVGREAERAQLDQLIARARRGHSGVLVLRGEPGIGKSALLDYAVERADGVEILRTVGLESASELPFAALADLLRPAVGHLDRLPKSQAEVLNAALALGSGGQASRYPVAAATLSLVAAEAEETPVLCAIDDAHWIDRASAESLVFTARRLEAEGVVMVFAARTGEGAFEALGLPELELGGLPTDAARALLARTGRRVARGVGERLAAETAGNPLALLELSSLLSERQLAGHEPLDTPLPAGARVEAAFLRRTRVLSNEAQLALLLAAASDSEDLAFVARAGATPCPPGGCARGRSGRGPDPPRPRQALLPAPARTRRGLPECSAEGASRRPSCPSRSTRRRRGC